MPEPKPASAKQPIDLSQLSLAQLQKLAERGSRRAFAELQTRLRTAPDDLSKAPAPSSAPSARARVRLALNQPDLSTPDLPLGRLPRTPLAAVPPMPPQALAANTTNLDPRVQQLTLLAQQDEAESRFDQLPQLIGWLLLLWGAMLTFAGAVMSLYRGGFYYLALSPWVLLVGWLLHKRSPWALPLQAVLSIVALAWAWQASQHAFGSALLQASPVAMVGVWMFFPRMREPLG